MWQELRGQSARRIAVAGLAFCALMMGVALFLEHVLGLAPCPLCIFQRVAVLATALVLLVAALHNPAGWGARLYGGLGLVSVAAGIGIAGRHVWLQQLPADQVPSCGPGLDYMLEILPLQQVLSQVLTGSGECAEIGVVFLGLSLPAWTLIGFLLLMLFPLLLCLRKPLRGSRRRSEAI